MSVVVDHATVRYGAITALRGVTVEARRGAVTALVGPNAAGKSTLLRCLIGAIRPDSGAVLLDGRPVHRLSARQLARRVAYVPQRSTVAAAFTVREIVELGRYSLGPDHDAIDRALTALELRAIVERPYPALSVGQQQRVTLARAVAQLAPDGLLVLDEPTAAMDLRHARAAIDLFRDRATAGSSVVVAMHDLSAAVRAADDAWLLDGGRLVAAGPVEDVLRPDRLESVFGVPFEWVERGDGGGRVLVAGA